MLRDAIGVERLDDYFTLGHEIMIKYFIFQAGL